MFLSQFMSLICRQPLLFLLSFVSGAVAEPTTSLLKPNGTYGVNISTMKLTDITRNNSYDPNDQHRNVMISMFYPAVPIAQCTTRSVEYMPPATAFVEDQYYSQYGLPIGSFERLRLSCCQQEPQVPLNIDSLPLVLFSPGLGNSRLLYSGLAQSIASFGHLVVTIDHPYDANVVEFPDGTLTFGANISSDAQINLALRTRVEDVSFVLDQLSLAPIVRHLLPGVGSMIDTNKVTIYGHSLGGATAAAAMLNDRRLIGGVNLDGTFFGPVVQRGLDRPFLMFGHDGKNQSNDASWGDIWSHLRGWKLELMLHGAQHATFSDIPLLVKVLGLTQFLPPDTGALLGTLDGARALDIVSAYMVAFFDFVQNGNSSRLLRGPAPAYTEVSFVAKGGMKRVQFDS